MISRLSFLTVVLVVGSAGFGCGGVDAGTTCTFDPACNRDGTDAASGDTSVGDTNGRDGNTDGTATCSPGETKPAGDGCNTCTCNDARVFVCTKKLCPDTGPPPTDCPVAAPAKGAACIGKTHCIYKNPAGCPFGCDCVDSAWACVDPVCPGG
jgi:hypothetical protein